MNENVLKYIGGKKKKDKKEFMLTYKNAENPFPPNSAYQ